MIDESSTTSKGLLIEIETLVKAGSPINTSTLRLAGLIGYDRQPGNFFTPDRIIPNPDHPVNMIHRDDAIGLIESIIAKNLWGNTYNGVTDHHPSRQEFYSNENQKLGKGLPQFGSSQGLPKLVSGQKAIDETGYIFKHANLLTGWP